MKGKTFFLAGCEFYVQLLKRDLYVGRAADDIEMFCACCIYKEPLTILFIRLM